MKYRITRRLEFDYGHRVLGHVGKCRHLHGHRGVAEITIASDNLDRLAMVMDFSDIKSMVGGWIDANWDHNVLVNEADPLLSCQNNVFAGKQPYVMRNGLNPTAEVMAKELYLKCVELLQLDPKDGVVEKVRLYETPNCWADYSCL